MRWDEPKLRVPNVPIKTCINRSDRPSLQCPLRAFFCVQRTTVGGVVPDIILDNAAPRLPSLRKQRPRAQSDPRDVEGGGERELPECCDSVSTELGGRRSEADEMSWDLLQDKSVLVGRGVLRPTFGARDGHIVS